MESKQMEENPSPHVKSMAAFLIRFYSDQLRSITLSPDSDLHYPLYIEFAELVDHDPPLAHLVFSRPSQYLNDFDDAAVWAHVSMSLTSEGLFSIFSNSSFEGNIGLCIKPHHGSSQSKLPTVEFPNSTSEITYLQLPFGIGAAAGFILIVTYCFLSHWVLKKG